MLVNEDARDRELRKAADEAVRAHELLDGLDVPRTNPTIGLELSLPGRIAYLAMLAAVVRDREAAA